MSKALRIVGFTLCAILFVLCASAHAPQPGKILRIGRLDVSTASGGALLWEAFQNELSKFGWVEGQNIAIEYRFAEQTFERLPELAAELVRLNVDIIIATGRAPALATTTIPIVMIVPDPVVGEGLVASLARPGGNVTGLSNLSPELNTKRLETLKDTLPKIARVGHLQQAGGRAASLKQLRAAAPVLKLKLEEISIQPTTDGIHSALRTVQQKQIDAIIIGGGRTLFAERKRVVELVGNSGSLQFTQQRSSSRRAA